jgi:hypothetical protein
MAALDERVNKRKLVYRLELLISPVENKLPKSHAARTE